jgi:hypothetical protein
MRLVLLFRKSALLFQQTMYMQHQFETEQKEISSRGSRCGVASGWWEQHRRSEKGPDTQGKDRDDSPTRGARGTERRNNPGRGKSGQGGSGTRTTWDHDVHRRIATRQRSSWVRSSMAEWTILGGSQKPYGTQPRSLRRRMRSTGKSPRKRCRNGSPFSPMPKPPVGEWYRRTPARARSTRSRHEGTSQRYGERDWASPSRLGGVQPKRVSRKRESREWAKLAAGSPNVRGVELLPRSLARLKREISEKKRSEARQWARSRITKAKYRMPARQKPDGVVAGSSKRLASRFYQLKTGHCLTGNT